MFFRPLPALTVACTLLFAFLIGLGVWQLQRLQWKLGLIALVNANMAAAPITLDQALAMGPAAQFHRVVLHGRFNNSRESYIFGTGVEGAPVFHVVVPFETDDNRVLLVDRGIVPRDMRNPATRPDGIHNGVMKLVGVWHAPDPPGPFTPLPDLPRRIWFSRNVGGMARVDHEVLAAEILVEADATPNPGGWPRGGQTVVTFRNEHLQYAITWFLMAAALVGVYLAFHVSRGRLGLKPRD
jgi:surfeit locus 1 family protein